MRVAEIARGVRWYVRGVMGDDAYDRYLAHVRGEHGDGEHGDAEHGDGEHGDAAAVMTEREFWRDRTDRQDSSPQGRCC